MFEIEVDLNIVTKLRFAGNEENELYAFYEETSYSSKINARQLDSGYLDESEVCLSGWLHKV
jgi:hypothetical protein